MASFSVTQRYYISGLLLALLVAGCQTTHPGSGLTGVTKPPSVCALQGRWGGCVGDSQAAARLQRIGRRVQATVPGLDRPCVFELVDSPHFNALCLEQFVFVTRGLYEQLVTDDLVAAVLGHELAHIAANDQLKPSSSRRVRLKREIAADYWASNYMVYAGYDPHALVELLLIIENDQPAGWAEQRLDALNNGHSFRQ